jgi:hypothetical protein
LSMNFSTVDRALRELAVEFDVREDVVEGIEEEFEAGMEDHVDATEGAADVELFWKST